MAQPGIITTGLVAEWHAARAHLGIAPGQNALASTQLWDTSGNTKHGTLTTFGFTAASGYTGTGTLADPHRLVFDGTSDYVDCGDLSLCEDKSCSYEAWFRTTNSAADNYSIVGEANTGVSGWVAHLAIYAGYLYAQVVDAAYASYLAGGITIVSDGLWHHAVMTWGGSNKLALYLDGALNQGDISGPAGTPVITTAAIGRALSSKGWLGDIACARMYSSALSLTELQQHYAAGYLWPRDFLPGSVAVPSSRYSIIMGDLAVPVS